MLVLTNHNYKQLIRGASLLTTGGGLAYKYQLQSMKDLGSFSIPIKKVSEFMPDDSIVTVAEVGPAHAPPIEKNKIITKMISIYRKFLDKEIKGIYPFEIGQESITLESAHFLELPIADFDSAGCRAVPFFDINIFNLKNIKYSFSPMVVCNDQNEIFFISEPMNSIRTEEVLREMTSLSKTGIVFFIGGLVRIKNLLKHKLHIDTPYNYAFALAKNATFSSLMDDLDPCKILELTVQNVQTIEKQGFLLQKVQLNSEKGDSFSLTILNEAIMLQNQFNQTIASVPQRILMIDKKRLKGMESGSLKKGVNVTLVVIAPTNHWKGKKADKIFGINRFLFLSSSS